jgi:hypothetical protein
LVFFPLLLTFGGICIFMGLLAMFRGRGRCVVDFVSDDRVDEGKKTTSFLELFTTHYYINIKIIKYVAFIIKITKKGYNLKKVLFKL